MTDPILAGEPLKNLAAADTADGIELYGVRAGRDYRVRAGKDGVIPTLDPSTKRLHPDYLDAGLKAAPARLDALEDELATVAAGVTAGMLGYDTRAALFADLAHGAGALALVTNDATAAYNGTYRKTGASGTGAWVLSADRVTAAEAGIADVRTRGRLVLNRGADFPQRAGTYNSTTSFRNEDFAKVLLDVKVIGARPGKVYAIRYFVNGSTVLNGNHPWGWIIDEHDAATYATSSARVQVMARADAAPEFPLSGKPETIRVASSRVPGLVFVITVDTSQLPAWGTAINANTAAQPGYSWIIDPYNYEAAAGTAAATSKSSGPALFTVNEAARSISMAWRLNSSHLFRLNWAPHGFNSLFNFVSIERSAGTVDLEAAVWTVISGGSTTDWIPPLTIEAASGDGGPTVYTGGNHGSNGDASGAQTAHMVSWECWVDGEALRAGAVFGGRATEVVVRWVNEIMAYNTISLTRYAMRQTVVAKFRAGMVEVMIEHEALEALTVKVDNGLQMRGDAYEATVHYYGGSAKGREAGGIVTDSGTKAIAPDAWAISCGGSYGYQVAWLDRATGAGSGVYVAAASPLLRKNATSWKFYQAIVAGVNVPMAAGEIYQYRGGYAWAPPGIVSGDVDSAFVARMGSKDVIGWAFQGDVPHSGGRVVLPADLMGREALLTGALVSGRGLPISAPGYAATLSEIK